MPARGWYATIANRSGDYSAALGSAEQGVSNDPNDALAYFNKAYALAGNGDKDGMVDALKQAARIDPSYAQALEQVQASRAKDALDVLFGVAAKQRQPAVPLPRHRREFTLMMMTGFVAAFLIVSGCVLFFRSDARPAVGRT